MYVLSWSRLCAESIHSNPKFVRFHPVLNCFSPEVLVLVGVDPQRAWIEDVQQNQPRGGIVFLDLFNDRVYPPVTNRLLVSDMYAMSARRSGDTSSVQVLNTPDETDGEQV